MGLFVKTLLPLSLCFLICAQLSATASLPSNFAGRHKRSDDKNPLDAVISQMTAKLTVAEAKISAMQADLTTLKAKHCQTGQIRFTPHDKTETINGEYHERRHTLHVTFSHPFNTVPWVAISLVGVDEDSDHNLRVQAGTSAASTSGFDAYAYEWADPFQAVSTSGFDACAIQWSDTHLHNVMATWVACNV